MLSNNIYLEIYNKYKPTLKELFANYYGEKVKDKWNSIYPTSLRVREDNW